MATEDARRASPGRRDALPSRSIYSRSDTYFSLLISFPAGAQLWACLLEEAERTIQSVAAFVAAVVGAASAIASAQLTAALGF